jgi:hypothetical protein
MHTSNLDEVLSGDGQWPVACGQAHDSVRARPPPGRPMTEGAGPTMSIEADSEGSSQRALASEERTERGGER